MRKLLLRRTAVKADALRSRMAAQTPLGRRARARGGPMEPAPHRGAAVRAAPLRRAVGGRRGHRAEHPVRAAEAAGGRAHRARDALSERPPRFTYALTDEGLELAGVLRLLADWGSRGSAHAEPMRHAACGTPVEARLWCPTCARSVDEPGGRRAALRLTLRGRRERLARTPSTRVWFDSILGPGQSPVAHATMSERRHGDAVSGRAPIREAGSSCHGPPLAVAVFPHCPSGGSCVVRRLLVLISAVALILPASTLAQNPSPADRFQQAPAGAIDPQLLPNALDDSRHRHRHARDDR